MEEDFSSDSPFHGLHIASHAPLRGLKSRYICSGCQKSTRYFCYRCVQLAPGLSIPSVHLPLNLCIVKHARELEGKTTAVHAKLLAPGQVELVSYDPKDESLLRELEKIPSEESVLLYPDETARLISEVDWSGVRRLVVIDGTWQQAKAMVRSPCLAHLTRRVCLSESNKTLFWRYQHVGLHCLSTIEAIYRFYQEYSAHQNTNPSHNLDNLLYFFSFYYTLIQDDYAQNPERRYTHKHRRDYIQSKHTRVDE